MHRTVLALERGEATKCHHHRRVGPTASPRYGCPATTPAGNASVRNESPLEVVGVRKRKGTKAQRVDVLRFPLCAFRSTALRFRYSLQKRNQTITAVLTLQQD